MVPQLSPHSTGRGSRLSEVHAIPRRRPLPRLFVGIINLAASIQLVWFYVNRIPPHIQLLAYEQGRERTPFQYRLLMMYPMRWAHRSATIVEYARRLNAMHGFFPNGVRPEGLLQAPIDLVCVVIAGIVARRLYRKSSPTAILLPFLYPLTLVMIATTYCLLDMHLLRFIYDLPSLALFALGLEAIYFRRNALWLAGLFVIATINRETSLFLLLFFAIAQCARDGQFQLRRLYSFATLKVVAPLALFWMAWHEYVVHRYLANASGALSRISLNAGILLVPLTWPQLLGTFGYLGPLVWICRKRMADPTMRAWIWVAPVWVAFMFYYGILIETRIFGEMIPYFACAAALVCEESLLPRRA
jgi:hypothetical protein